MTKRNKQKPDGLLIADRALSRNVNLEALFSFADMVSSGLQWEPFPRKESMSGHTPFIMKMIITGHEPGCLPAGERSCQHASPFFSIIDLIGDCSYLIFLARFSLPCWSWAFLSRSTS